jgi:adenylate cyclase
MQMFSILGDLRIYYLGFGKHRRIRELAAQMVKISEKQGSKELLAEAYFHWGDTLMFGGQFRDALNYLERAINHCQPGQKVAADIDALTMALNRAAPTLWSLGYADQALDACRRVTERATGIKHPASIAVAQFTYCVVRRLRRDAEAEHEAETLAAFASEHGFSYYEGVALLERSLATQVPADLLPLVEFSRLTGLKLMLPNCLAALAQAYGRMGDPNRGLDYISEAFAEIEVLSEGRNESELYRIKGELLLIQNASNAEQAQPLFRKAVEIARRQEARFYELRASISLARLFDQQGHRQEARAVLSEIYNWFTEGFDTADLKDAKALLDELGA